MHNVIDIIRLLTSTLRLGDYLLLFSHAGVDMEEFPFLDEESPASSPQTFKRVDARAMDELMLKRTKDLAFLCLNLINYNEILS